MPLSAEIDRLKRKEAKARRRSKEAPAGSLAREFWSWRAAIARRGWQKLSLRSMTKRKPGWVVSLPVHDVNRNEDR